MRAGVSGPGQGLTERDRPLLRPSWTPAKGFRHHGTAEPQGGGTSWTRSCAGQRDRYLRTVREDRLRRPAAPPVHAVQARAHSPASHGASPSPALLSVENGAAACRGPCQRGPGGRRAGSVDSPPARRTARGRRRARARGLAPQRPPRSTRGTGGLSAIAGVLSPAAQAGLLPLQ